ncbi:MAG: YggS family pyridoxal phosphate-dependent enzyme [Crocinitomicaceae bacterium]|nr:YggS family pyridoxal phosphate-dependent enzyme [Crocinitomicaceae bacterium]
MIKESLRQILDRIPDSVTLVAVSKTKPNSDILEAYESGQRIFGENKVQELTQKYEDLPKDIEWHMIGHLQSNKVKYIAPFVHLIHGIDSFKLLKEVNKQGEKNDRIIPVLLQFHIAQEDTKFGFSLDEAADMLSSTEYKQLCNVQIKGVMGMATFTSDSRQVREEFHDLKLIFDKLKKQFFNGNSDFEIISMGMSGDYELAIEQGSNMIRVGSSIFGGRH